MSEYENVHHVTEFNNTLKQLAKTFGREKWVIVKYQGDYKYVHIFDNRKEANYPGITLGYDEFLTDQDCSIYGHGRSLLQKAGQITSLMLNCFVQLYDKFYLDNISVIFLCRSVFSTWRTRFIFILCNSKQVICNLFI